MVITKDDWELTLKELESQRLQVSIQLEILNAGILHLKSRIKAYKNEPKKDIP